MMKYPCPSCGAEIEFQSSTSVFVVCRYCHSTVVKMDTKLETLGKVADLLTDASPFQIGTTGKFQKQNFTLIGRVQLTYDEGSWNEWFARFDSGQEGWLAEAQGFYMLSTPVNDANGLPTLAELAPEKTVLIAKVEYKIDDIKKVKYTFAQGELPFVAMPGYEATSVDLSHGEHDFASLSYDVKGDVDVFTGMYLDFEAFQFKNLREIDGW